jgi:hypothetical protein
MINQIERALLTLPTRAALAIIISACAAVTSAQTPMQPDAEWAVEGQWVETCNCAIPCPCWNETPTLPTHADCGDMLFFHVTKGHYGLTKLDGVNVVQMAVSANGKTMDQSSQDQDFKVNTLYLSDALSPEVSAAAGKVFSRMTLMPLSISKSHVVRRVSMEVSLEADTVSIKIPGVLDAQIVQVKDTQGQPVPFPYNVQVVPYLGKGIQGKSVRYEYHDGGQSWIHKDTNGTWASFSYSSKQLPLPWDPDYKPPVPQQPSGK